MQTYLPFPDFERSAAILDRKRLGQQRVEAWQILQAMDMRSDSPMVDHPAVKMWTGYPLALISYLRFIIARWTEMGYHPGNHDTLEEMFWHGDFVEVFPGGSSLPPWIGDEKLHLSHQSTLKREDPEHYEHLFVPDIPLDLPIQWPMNFVDSYDYYLVEGGEPNGPGKG